MAKLEYAPNNFKGVRGFAPSLTPIPAMKTLVIPSKTLLNGFSYTRASETDVRETWKRFGWKPIHD